jgi:ACS family pantothenate transporter-like MFS transporter
MLTLDLLPGRWHVYLLTILYIVFINIGPSASVNPFSLWLKSQGVSISKIVSYPTCQILRYVLTI